MPMGQLKKILSPKILNENEKDKPMFIPKYDIDDLPSFCDTGQIIYVVKENKVYTAVSDGTRFKINENPISC